MRSDTRWIRTQGPLLPLFAAARTLKYPNVLMQRSERLPHPRLKLIDRGRLAPRAHEHRLFTSPVSEPGTPQKWESDLF